jgi:CheY-like chemotaxis protein
MRPLASSSQDDPSGPIRGSTDDRLLHSRARTVFSVLVVDDEPAKRYAMARALSAAGYRIVEAGSAAEALASFDRHAAVVLDVYLPDMFGFDVCRHMRAARPALPIVQVSSVLVDERYRREGEAAGASAYLADPTAADLVRVLDDLLDVGGAPPAGTQ